MLLPRQFINSKKYKKGRAKRECLISVIKYVQLLFRVPGSWGKTGDTASKSNRTSSFHLQAVKRPKTGTTGQSTKKTAA